VIGNVCGATSNESKANIMKNNIRIRKIRKEKTISGTPSSGTTGGSMIIEILLSLAIFSIICLPILIFVFSSEEFRVKKIRAESAEGADRIMTERYWLDPDTVNGYSNRHACDLAFASHATTGSSSTPVIWLPNFFTHPRNMPTTIRFIHRHGDRYLLIGTDSASTTDSDLYAYTIPDLADDIAPPSPQLLGEYELGPGIVDFDISADELYFVERSTVQASWRIALADVLSRNSAVSESGTGTGTSTAPISVMPLSTLPLGALPLRIMSGGEYVFIGLDKNPGREIQVFRKLSGSTGFALVQGIETDAGINDMQLTPRELLVATPNEVEFMSFAFGPDGVDGASSTPWRTFNAPGSSGNGKAIAAYKHDAYLGRTIGNVEFYKVGDLADWHSVYDMDDAHDTGAVHVPPYEVRTSFDLNKTIIQIEEMFGGTYLAMLAKTPNPALEIFARNPSASVSGGGGPASGYARRLTVPLPAIPTSMTCTDRDFVVAMNSTTTPIAIIRL
jgi:hypothetical protein